MNASKLRATIQSLLENENRFSVQNQLSNLNSYLQNFASSPHPDNQINVSNGLRALRDTLEALSRDYDPAALKRIKEIGAENYFTEELVSTINKSIADNAMTPAVVQRQVEDLFNQRANYLRWITNIQEGLGAIGIETDALTDGQGEIGFQIPRDIFRNELTGLVSELSAIRRIIRAFAEVATGSVESIEVRQISTSDPTFFFGLSLSTIALLGGAVTWALNTWKQVEEIKKVRAETSKLTAFTPEETSAIFDAKIKQSIEAAINEKTAQLLPAADEEAGRVHEQRTDMAWALEAVLARVERGMTVEIKFLPPSNPTQQMSEATQTLSEVIPQLTFPEPEPNPVLKLPKAADEAN